MTMTASLTVVGNPIMGSSTTCILNVANSSGAVVNVTGIQPKVVSPLSYPLSFGQVFVSPGVAVPSSGGSQQQVAIPASGNVNFAFQFVPMGGAVATGLPQQAAQQFLLGADIICSDGSEISPVPQAVAVQNPVFGGYPGSPPNINTTRGELQFNQVPFSGLFPTVVPL